MCSIMQHNPCEVGSIDVRPVMATVGINVNIPKLGDDAFVVKCGDVLWLLLLLVLMLFMAILG